MIKYIIGFQFGKNDQRYIKECSAGRPVLSQQPHLVKSGCVCDTKEDAQKGIDSLVADAGKALAFHQKYKPNPKRDSWDYNQMRTLKRFADSKRYSIVEYEPDFVFKKERKASRRGWIEDKTSSKFCHVCGTNMIADKYFQIGQQRICPFCIKNLAKDADQIIDRLKEENPDIVDHHMNTTFLGHLE